MPTLLKEITDHLSSLNISQFQKRLSYWLNNFYYPFTNIIQKILLTKNFMCLTNVCTQMSTIIYLKLSNTYLYSFSHSSPNNIFILSFIATGNIPLSVFVSSFNVFTTSLYIPIFILSKSCLYL